MKDENRRSNFWEQTQSILLAAFVSWVAGLSTPLQAEAKRPEPPAPVPTAYDVSTAFQSHAILSRMSNLPLKLLQEAIELYKLSLNFQLFLLQELQNIVSSRSGTSGSLLENFRKAAAAPANGKKSQPIDPDSSAFLRGLISNGLYVVQEP